MLPSIFHEDVERDEQGFEVHEPPPFGKKFGVAMGLETGQRGREGAQVPGKPLGGKGPRTGRGLAADGLARPDL